MATASSQNQIGISGTDQVLEVDLQALYAEMSALETEDGEGLFMTEIADRLNVGRKAANDFVRRAIDAGVCHHTKKRFKRINGVVAQVDAYVFCQNGGGDDA